MPQSANATQTQRFNSSSGPFLCRTQMPPPPDLGVFQDNWNGYKTYGKTTQCGVCDQDARLPLTVLRCRLLHRRQGLVEKGKLRKVCRADAVLLVQPRVLNSRQHRGLEGGLLWFPFFDLFLDEIVPRTQRL